MWQATYLSGLNDLELPGLLQTYKVIFDTLNEESNNIHDGSAVCFGMESEINKWNKSFQASI